MSEAWKAQITSIFWVFPTADHEETWPRLNLSPDVVQCWVGWLFSVPAATTAVVTATHDLKITFANPPQHTAVTCFGQSIARGENEEAHCFWVIATLHHVPEVQWRWLLSQSYSYFPLFVKSWKVAILLSVIHEKYWFDLIAHRGDCMHSTAQAVQSQPLDLYLQLLSIINPHNLGLIRDQFISMAINSQRKERLKKNKVGPLVTCNVNSPV